MGKRPNKKEVLFIVEGTSDATTLEQAIGQLYDAIDPEIHIDFLTMRDDDGDYGGDITSKKGVKPENIERLVNEIILKPFLISSGLMPKDIIRVIQIVDIDGAFVSDEMVHFSDKAVKAVYHPDSIETDKVEDFLLRNERKSANLRKLSALEQIKVQSKTVPYSVFFFSSNLDHFLYGDANADDREKGNNARDFSYFNNTGELLLKAIKDIESHTIDMDYHQSWAFIMEGNNSLKRHTNLHVLLENLINR